jgi:acyl-CoA thioesterase FadM
MTGAAAPLEHDGLDLSVRPEWLDFNGHMNIAHYVAAFEMLQQDHARIGTPPQAGRVMSVKTQKAPP